MRTYPKRLGWFSSGYVTSDGRVFQNASKASEIQMDLDLEEFVNKIRQEYADADGAAPINPAIFNSWDFKFAVKHALKRYLRDAN